MSTTLPTIGALGTSWWIEVFDNIDEKSRQVIHDDCAVFLQAFEKQYSRFNPDSYISKLNAGQTITNPNQELIDVLAFGRDQFERTNGIFNIMVGSALIESGYDAEYSFTPTTKKTPLLSPYETLTIAPDHVTLHQGQIDIGGFGKGYAIDALVLLLHKKHHLKYFLVNGGGDMFATSDNETPITVYLEHPTVAGTYLTTTTLYNQGFAASSPHKRAWQFAGTTYTHIINTTNVPTTHNPDATFIKAESACTADIFATVALIVTPAAMNSFAEQEELGVASYTVSDNSFIHNHAFVDVHKK